VDEGSQVSGRYLVGVEKLPREAIESREEILRIQEA